MAIAGHICRAARNSNARRRSASESSSPRFANEAGPPHFMESESTKLSNAGKACRCSLRPDSAAP